MKIGITERGDAGRDLSWSSKMDSVDGAVIISKSLTDELIDALLRYQSKVIFHNTCTGYGGSVLEPHVPLYQTNFRQLQKLIESGFDPARVVLRVDPIIPTPKGLDTFCSVVLDAPKQVERCRISVLDMYPHVRKRFLDSGLPDPYQGKFQASDEQFDAVIKTIENRLGGRLFEVCNEPKLVHPNIIQSGCIAEADLNILEIDISKSKAGGYQRRGCLCLGNKTELLTQKHQCPNRCMYCYWK